MKKKNQVIEGDKFQKEHKDKLFKDKITNLIEGITAIIVGILGLSMDQNFFLKVAIYIIPIAILLHVLRRVFLLIKNIENKRAIVGEVIQLMIMIIFSMYILFNPIDSLAILLQVFGIFILIKAILIVITTNYPIPLGTILIGILLTFFATNIIGALYIIFFVIVLVYGLSKILKAMYTN